ncbi:MAG: ABC transporter permease [Alphaproteobacteria bacterium]|nr:ABC transporter permease [Alphaproteobacteria bacterium]MDE2012300.1 ABC transporter permease [Alphaproteobacteria bacterium]
MSGLWVLSERMLRHALRVPIFLALALIQPLLWLTLFGSLFSGLGRLPIFGSGGYLAYLTPGIAVMSAVFGAGYSGLQLLRDLERGFVDTLFTTPTGVVAIALAPAVQTAVTTSIQVMAIVLIGVALAAYPTNLGLALPAMAALGFVVGFSFAALSNALAIASRQPSAVLGTINFLLLPLLFTSSLLMSPEGMPKWMRSAAIVNPVDWAGSIGRSFYHMADPNLTRHIVLLVLFALAMGVLSVMSVRAYRASL